MKITSFLSASAVVLAVGLAMPASAQVASGTAGGAATATGFLNSATTNTTSTDIGLSNFANDQSMNDSHDNNSINDSGNTDLAFALGSFNTDNSNNSTNNSNNNNDSSSVVATQTLLAVNANLAPLNFMSLALSDYSSGDNSVAGGAFAAYSGILNQGWNTGINANAQAATNIAARGTVTFSQ
jgi:hypothetical protein